MLQNYISMAQAKLKTKEQEKFWIKQLQNSYWIRLQVTEQMASRNGISNIGIENFLENKFFKFNNKVYNLL